MTIRNLTVKSISTPDINSIVLIKLSGSSQVEFWRVYDQDMSLLGIGKTFFSTISVQTNHVGSFILIPVALTGMLSSRQNLLAGVSYAYPMAIITRIGNSEIYTGNPITYQAAEAFSYRWLLDGVLVGTDRNVTVTLSDTSPHRLNLEVSNPIGETNANGVTITASVAPIISRPGNCVTDYNYAALVHYIDTRNGQDSARTYRGLNGVLGPLGAPYYTSSGVRCNVYLPTGRGDILLGFNDGDFPGHLALGQVTDLSITRVDGQPDNCDPPITSGHPANEGQCSVAYYVYFQFNNRFINERPETRSSFQGPVKDFRVYEVNIGQSNQGYVFNYKNAQFPNGREEPCGANSTNYAYEGYRFVRVDGLPDNCAPLAPLSFTGGQCLVNYLVTYFLYISPSESHVDTLTFPGAIGKAGRYHPPGQSDGLYIHYGVNPSNLEGAYYGVFYNIPSYPTAYLNITSVVRQDGLPDNCGNSYYA